jgi:hypothetical protein
MNNVKMMGLMVVLAVALGCDKGTKPSDTPKAAPAGKESEEHPHGKGPNGGVVFDLGKYHAEFTVDHGKAEATVLMLGADEKTPKAVAAKELTLTTKETKTKEGKVVPPMTVKLIAKDEADGKASKFVGTDPGIGNVADFSGTVIGQIDGRPSSGEFKE